MNNSVNIIVLSDNRSVDNCFKTEHGLAVYLETANYKYLLDTGAGDLYLNNAEKLSIDITDIDFVFISHGHSDHTGGLESILEINKKCKVVLSNKIAGHDFYSLRLEKRYIGTNLDFKKYLERIIYVDDFKDFDEFFVFNPGQKLNAVPKANEFLFDGIEKDKFEHELIFCLKSDNTILFSGCAHSGVLNILSSFKQFSNKKPGIVIGGFHLPDSNSSRPYETAEDLRLLGKVLNEEYSETDFITGHCTGDNAYKILKSMLNNKLDAFYVGYKLNI